jgi:hypothetical protein
LSISSPLTYFHLLDSVSIDCYLFCLRLFFKLILFDNFILIFPIKFDSYSFDYYCFFFFFPLVRFFKLFENKASWLNPDSRFYGLWVLKTWPNLEGSLEFTWFFILLCLNYFFLVSSLNIYLIEDWIFFFNLCFVKVFVGFENYTIISCFYLFIIPCGIFWLIF